MPAPIVILGVISGAAYVAWKAKARADNQVAPKGNPTPQIGAGTGTTNPTLTERELGNRLITNERTADGSFSFGGRAPKKDAMASQPVNAVQVLGSIMGVVVPVLGVVAAVGGGSLTAGIGIIASAVGAGAAIAVAILAIVGAIVILSFSVFSEVDGLSKGRAQYMSDLRKMANSVRDAVRQNINADQMPGSNQPQKDGLADKWAACFAFLVVRGYNRSQIAYCLSNSDIVNNAFASGNGTTNEYIINHWADRSRCIPEKGYVYNEDQNHQALLIMMGQRAQVEGTIESILFPPSAQWSREGLTCADAIEDLKSAGVWHPVSTPGNEEDSADFLGRALGCTNVAVKHWSANGGTEIIFNAAQNAKRFVSFGMIANRKGLPTDAPYFSKSAAQQAAESVPYFASVDVQNGTVTDTDGNSGLKWFYDETVQTNQTVVR